MMMAFSLPSLCFDEEKVVGLPVSIDDVTTPMTGIPHIRLNLRIQDDEDDDQVRKLYTGDGEEQCDVHYPALSSPLSRPLTIDELRGGKYMENIDREWKELKKLCNSDAFSEADYRPNREIARTRNRYADVLPTKNTRVILQQSPVPEQNADYINANFVRDSLYMSERKYIATQAPTDVSINEFWCMVWEQKVCSIVMLTKEQEDGVVKSSVYWPDGTTKSPMHVGNGRQVRFDSQEYDADCGTSVIIRKLTIVDENDHTERKIVHVQYTDWSDQGVPKDFSQFAKVFACYRKYQESVDPNSPILMHCSAGLGRTGTFIAIDLMLLHLQRSLARKAVSPSVNPAALVFELRKQRRKLVQTQDQYEFICSFISHCAKTGEFLDTSNIIVPARERSISINKRFLKPMKTSRAPAPTSRGGGPAMTFATIIDTEDESPTMHMKTPVAPTASLLDRRNSSVRQSSIF